MEYSFNIELAKKYGVNEAIMLKNLLFWIEKNKANDKHFHDGYYWTYNSIRAFALLFPFWSDKQIRGILERLQQKGAIKKGNYNTVGYDRTLWYTIIDESITGICICPKRQIEIPKKANLFAHEGEPIPDINTDKKPDNKHCETATRILLYLNEKADRNYKPNKNTSLKNIIARLKEGYTEKQCMRVIDVKTSQWKSNTKMNQYLNYTTLFRPTKFPLYLEEKKLVWITVEKWNPASRKKEEMWKQVDENDPRVKEQYE